MAIRSNLCSYISFFPSCSLLWKNEEQYLALSFVAVMGWCFVNMYTASKAMPAKRVPYPANLTAEWLWKLICCKSLTDESVPIALYSFLLGYDQQMYHASENFCDAEKCLLSLQLGVYVNNQFAFCDVIIRVFFQFVVLWTKSTEQFMKSGKNRQMFSLSRLYVLYNMYSVCII